MTFGEMQSTSGPAAAAGHCPSCGSPAVPGARFCAQCGAALPEQQGPATAPSRKLVTLLFADVTGSTALGESVDAETFRHVMQRYYGEAKAVVERHGGTVEKFIGDAVMAVFGIPVVHEDDALRAVRAAAGIRGRVAEMSDQLEQTVGVRIAVRIGVNSGEVIAADPASGQSFASGDAVNVAARLEQAAEPGEILIGSATRGLVRGAIEAEPVEPLALKGKSEAVPAWRVGAVLREVGSLEREAIDTIVGRGEELGRLVRALDATAEDRALRMVTVLGGAGIGKTRLAEEFLRVAGERATVLRGQCLPYGSFTFWPLAEVVRQAAAIADSDSPDDAVAKLARLSGGDDGDSIARYVAGAVGIAPVASPYPEETFWAVRRLLQAIGCEGPVVLVFDDLQWAEPTFLDLIDYLVRFAHSAPVLLVCLARPELLDERPRWGATGPDAENLHLKPLDERASADLLARLGDGPLPAPVIEQIAGQAEGNPLFMQEMLRALIEEGHLERVGGEWRLTGPIGASQVPLSIRALLSARLDRLTAPERTVMQRASVVGREFWWGAVAHLSAGSDRPNVGSALQSLTGRAMIRPASSFLDDEDAFAFAHRLMQDVTYNAMPKSERAMAHERLADWLARKLGDRAAEHDEVLGYHLEQAHHLLRQLGDGERLAEVGQRAGRHLVAAGRRAHSRGDLPAANDLLDRAIALLPEDDPLRVAALLRVGEIQSDRGQLEGAVRVFDQAIASATALGDDGARMHAELLKAYARSFTHGDEGLARLESLARDALTLFETLGDEEGSARAWQALATVQLAACHWGQVESARRRQVAHARAAGDEARALRGLSGLAFALYFGPTPAAEALAGARRILDDVAGHPVAEATALAIIGGLSAMQGEFGAARDAAAAACSKLTDLGMALPAAEASFIAADIELLAGEPEAAAAILERICDDLERLGEKAILSSVSASLADVLCRLGDLERAAETAERSTALTDEDDVYVQAVCRTVEARLAAARGEGERGRALAAEAVGLTQGADDPNLNARALETVAEVLTALGDPAAAGAADAAVAAYARKGNEAAAAGVRARFAGVRA